MVIAGGAKVSDKINVLKQFVQVGVKAIFIGGKMVNTFLIAQKVKTKMVPFNLSDIQRTLLSSNEENNQNLVNEVSLAGEILDFASDKKVNLIFPDDYKCVDEFKATTFFIEAEPDFEKVLQLDLGPKTI